jgi:poly(hydroxyalkanoate) granule-associated protein
MAAIVGSAVPFKVIDSATGEDITLAVLGQMLISELRDRENIAKTKKILIELINQGGKRSMSILRNTYLAGVGMYNLTRKKAEEIVDSLIKAGDISKSEKKQAVLELLDKAEQSTKKMKDKIVKESGIMQKDFSKVIDKFKLATKKDITDLNKKIDKLARALEKQK